MSIVKITKQLPPKMIWKAFKPNKNLYNTMFWGRVNIGSEHECFQSFIADFDKEYGLLDKQGDKIVCVSVTHYLKIKSSSTDD